MEGELCCEWLLKRLDDDQWDKLDEHKYSAVANLLRATHLLNSDLEAPLEKKKTQCC